MNKSDEEILAGVLRQLVPEIHLLMHLKYIPAFCTLAKGGNDDLTIPKPSLEDILSEIYQLKITLHQLQNIVKQAEEIADEMLNKEITGFFESE